MKNHFLFLSIVMLSISSLFAQNASEPPDPKDRIAWIVSTSLPEGLENPVSIMSGEDIIEVTLSKRSPSAPIKIPADGTLKIVRKIAHPTEPGKTEYLTIAQASVAESVTRALIILIPLVKDPTEHLFETRVQDLAEFEGGDWLFLNATEYKVGIDMGKSAILVNPGETKIYHAEPRSESIEMTLRYSANVPEEESWKVISSSSVAYFATRREICIFSWNPKSERIDYHGITFPVM